MARRCRSTRRDIVSIYRRRRLRHSKGVINRTSRWPLIGRGHVRARLRIDRLETRTCPRRAAARHAELHGAGESQSQGDHAPTSLSRRGDIRELTRQKRARARPHMVSHDSYERHTAASVLARGSGSGAVLNSLDKQPEQRLAAGELAAKLREAVRWRPAARHGPARRRCLHSCSRLGAAPPLPLRGDASAAWSRRRSASARRSREMAAAVARGKRAPRGGAGTRRLRGPPRRSRPGRLARRSLATFARCWRAGGHWCVPGHRGRPTRSDDRARDQYRPCAGGEAELDAGRQRRPWGLARARAVAPDDADLERMGVRVASAAAGGVAPSSTRTAHCGYRRRWRSARHSDRQRTGPPGVGPGAR